MFAKQLQDAKNKATVDQRPLWDWYYFQTLRNEKKDMLPTALALSKGPDPAGLVAYLNTVRSRETVHRDTEADGMVQLDEGYHAARFLPISLHMPWFVFKSSSSSNPAG